MENLIDKRVVLVAGKGGVGRSTMTAALAHLAAERGRNVLVVEVEEPSGGYSPLARLFGKNRLPLRPMKLADGIHGGQLTAIAGQELFLTSVLKVRSVAKLALMSRPLTSFLRCAPSFHEMGIFYHLLHHLRAEEADGSPRYDLVLVDMPATGHALALTGLPEHLLRLIHSGPIARLMREGQEILNNPETGSACVVTIPEILPITESMELIEGLRQTNMPVGGVFLNMVQENPFTAAEQVALGQMLNGHEFYGQRFLARIATTERASTLLRDKVDTNVLPIPYCRVDRDKIPQAIAERLLALEVFA